MIQYRILQTNIMRIVWQTVRRITKEILGVKWLKLFELFFTHFKMKGHYEMGLNMEEISSKLVKQLIWQELKEMETYSLCHFLT